MQTYRHTQWQAVTQNNVYVKHSRDAHTHIHTCSYIQVLPRTYTYINTGIYVGRHTNQNIHTLCRHTTTHTHAHRQTGIQAYMHTLAHTHRPKYTERNIYIHTIWQAYKHVYTHTNIHACTRAETRLLYTDAHAHAGVQGSRHAGRQPGRGQASRNAYMRAYT